MRKNDSREENGRRQVVGDATELLNLSNLQVWHISGFSSCIR
jgi:hypothetical protein